MRKPDVDLEVLGRLIAGVFGSVSFERTPDGASTQVYRISHGAETFYLRVAETAVASLAPEAALHTELLRRGVSVPAVVHFEPFDEQLQRSVLITTAIPGAPPIRYGEEGAVVGGVPPADRDVEAIYRAAGRDLALLNQVPVAGFGFVARGGAAWPLRGEYASYPDWVMPDLRALSAVDLTAADIDLVHQLLAEQIHSGPSIGSLAHGDFDRTHIFHRDGRYTGMIDLGEIRGTAGAYDIATFGIVRIDGGADTLRFLEAGYFEVAPRPGDHADQMRRTAIMIALHRLAIGYGRHGSPFYRR